MQENSWLNNHSADEPDGETSTEDFSHVLTPEPAPDYSEHPFFRGLLGRRRKAAVTLTLVWSSTVALHLFSGGYWLVLGLTTLMGIHVLRVLMAHPIPTPDPLSDGNPDEWAYVSLIVAAKNEEAVIRSLVRDLCNLDYPTSRYDLWVIDDHSTDRTPILLDRLATEYPNLHVIHRSADAGGGKSGALNQVWPITQGDIVAVFDADAQVPKDLIRRVLPLFDREQVGAVQVRKATSNASTNWLTRCQAAEMAIDSFFQQHRIAIGGIGELRGNGQFVRRAALEHCGGWNEATITDDLDLTLRLHLNQWDIDFLEFPAVGEEGVTRVLGLWHQRNRWAEGGYQRYLDYWRLIRLKRLGPRKTLDLGVFYLVQYLIPTAAVPDCLMSILRSHPPVLIPITSLNLTVSLIGMYLGLRRIQNQPIDSVTGQTLQNGTPGVRTASVHLGTLFQSIVGILYMLHWFPVIASTTARISIRPKRLKWVKTIHQGTDEVWFDVSEQSS